MLKEDFIKDIKATACLLELLMTTLPLLRPLALEDLTCTAAEVHLVQVCLIMVVLDLPKPLRPRKHSEVAELLEDLMMHLVGVILTQAKANSIMALSKAINKAVVMI